MRLIAVAVTVSCMPGWFRPAMASSDCWHQAVTTRGTMHFVMLCMLYTASFTPIILNQHKPDKPPTRSPSRPTFTTHSPTHPPLPTLPSTPNSPEVPPDNPPAPPHVHVLIYTCCYSVSVELLMCTSLCTRIVVVMLMKMCLCGSGAEHVLSHTFCSACAV